VNTAETTPIKKMSTLNMTISHKFLSILKPGESAGEVNESPDFM
jgi:hypothetical protein